MHCDLHITTSLLIVTSQWMSLAMSLLIVILQWASLAILLPIVKVIMSHET